MLLCGRAFNYAASSTNYTDVTPDEADFCKDCLAILKQQLINGK
jgi:hypothetical protein